jgi:hypothetical protein
MRNKERQNSKKQADECLSLIQDLKEAHQEIRELNDMLDMFQCEKNCWCQRQSLTPMQQKNLEVLKKNGIDLNHSARCIKIRQYKKKK